MNKKISLVATVFLCITVSLLSVLGTLVLTEGQYSAELEKYDAALKMSEILDIYDKLYDKQDTIKHILTSLLNIW